MNFNFLQKLQISVIAGVLFLPFVVQSLPFLSKVYWVTAPILLVIFCYLAFTNKCFRMCCFNSLSLCILCALVSYHLGIANTPSPISQEVVKDGVRGFVSLLAFLLACHVYKESSLFEKVNSLYRIAIVSVTACACVIGLAKLVLINGSYHISSSLSNFLGSNQFGTSLSSDGNFFSLSLMLGVIAIFHFWQFEQNPYKYLALMVAVNLVLLVGIGTGSRRFILVILPVILTCTFVLPCLTHRQREFSKVGLMTLCSVRKRLTKSLLSVGVIAGFFFFCWYYDLLSYFLQTNSIDSVSRFQTILHQDQSYGFDSRLQRFYHGWELFKYNPKFFGGDFSYRQSFACEFNHCAIEGYPHNAILSALLYGGVIGASFIIVIFSYYLFYSVLNLFGGSYNQTIGLSSLVTFAFCFVSGDSIFSLPIFFTMLTLARVAYANENA